MPKIKHTKKRFPCQCGATTNIEKAQVCDECRQVTVHECYECKCSLTCRDRTFILEAERPTGYVDEAAKTEEKKVPRIYYAYQSNPLREEAIQKRDSTAWISSGSFTYGEQVRVLPYCLECAMKLPFLKYWASYKEGCDSNFTPITKKEQLKVFAPSTANDRGYRTRATVKAEKFNLAI